MLSCPLEEALGITTARVWYCSFTHKLTIHPTTLSGIQGQRQGIVPYKDHPPYGDCCAPQAVRNALTPVKVCGRGAGSFHHRKEKQTGFLFARLSDPKLLHH